MQMWKLDGNYVVSKSLQSESNANQGKLGVNEDNVLAVYIGDGDLVEAVKTVEEYKTVNSTYKLSVKGLSVWDEILKMHIDHTKDMFRLDNSLHQTGLFLLWF